MCFTVYTDTLRHTLWKIYVYNNGLEHYEHRFVSSYTHFHQYHSQPTSCASVMKKCIYSLATKLSFDKVKRLLKSTNMCPLFTQCICWRLHSAYTECFREQGNQYGYRIFIIIVLVWLTKGHWMYMYGNVKMQLLLKCMFGRDNKATHITTLSCSCSNMIYPARVIFRYTSRQRAELTVCK